MTAALRFLWRASQGYRLRPWRSPLLRWRIETFSGMKAEKIGFRDFWSFTWRERRRLQRFLAWANQMETFRNHAQSLRMKDPWEIH